VVTDAPGAILEVGILAHRYSETPGYPGWPARAARASTWWEVFYRVSDDWAGGAVL
jgi:hypothetical protein